MTMRLRIVVVGRARESYWREAVEEYVGRLGRYAKVEEVEVKEGAHRVVAPALLQALRGPRVHVVALTIDGRKRTSEELASWLTRLERDAVEPAFVIGGADGLPPEVVAAAHETLSLSTMTLPHRLARLVLVEQLYRAMTIRKGEPYHH